MGRIWLFSACALAEQKRGLAWRSEALGRVRPEGRTRRVQVESAKLIAVKEAVGARWFALAAGLETPARQADGADPLPGSFFFREHEGDYASLGHDRRPGFAQTA